MLRSSLGLTTVVPDLTCQVPEKVPGYGRLESPRVSSREETFGTDEASTPTSLRRIQRGLWVDRSPSRSEFRCRRSKGLPKGNQGSLTCVVLEKPWDTCEDTGVNSLELTGVQEDGNP